ncbi:MAG: UDP-N-acetylmuramate--L-alanine ligase [Eubacteriales bacterium]|nr:UDP-N-acetylmuramate--L-alanine ligase [Eubacteriales bacterium]MDD3197796.1 UDP-N-acetylmuramate--L-alanine ligase [Eubacteriales bacterium]
MNNLSSNYKDINLQPGARIYFVGIGGISMSGLAELAQISGFKTAGADMHRGPRIDHLSKKGIKIYSGHSANNIDDFLPELVVYTAAIPEDNPELARAADLNIKTMDRASYLGWINRQYARVINISGTHGKTTTTAMCSLILIEAEQNPTVHLGAELIQFASTVRYGTPGDLMVSEACEYKRSFLSFFSTTAAVLNIDYDHVDCFADLNEVIDTFVDFSDKLPEDGILIVPAFDKNVVEMITRLKKRRVDAKKLPPTIIWFGANNDRNMHLSINPQFYWDNLIYNNGLPEFDLYFNNRFYGHFSLRVPGRHNVANAVSAAACAHYHGAEPEHAVSALNNFQGAEGRFTHTGYYHGARVIADYAHHPAAAAVTLAAASNIEHNHIWVVFQPLTFSRTQKLFSEYVDALKNCELVLMAEIFSDRETVRDYISSADIADEINRQGGNAVFCDDFTVIRQKLDEIVQPDDIILVLGPEDIRSLADQLTGRKDFMQDMR